MILTNILHRCVTGFISVDASLNHSFRYSALITDRPPVCLMEANLEIVLHFSLVSLCCHYLIVSLNNSVLVIRVNRFDINAIYMMACSPLCKKSHPCFSFLVSCFRGNFGSYSFIIYTIFLSISTSSFVPYMQYRCFRISHSMKILYPMSVFF